MSCPYLREAAVRYCEAAPVRKMLREPADPAAGERCSGAGHAACPWHRPSPDEPAEGRCPLLRDALVQYCGADTVARYVPYSEGLTSSCHGEGYRYCEQYLEQADVPGAPEESEHPAAPPTLAYTPNHLWLDLAPDGTAHVGIDGLLARALGQPDRVSFLTSAGGAPVRPSALVRTGGIDLPITFPRPLLVTRVNAHLRREPGLLAADPYGRGWLFEGRDPGGASRGTVPGAHARVWMDAEAEALARQLHARLPHRLAADGGTAVPGILARLDREEALVLFGAFFGADAGGGGR